jgi:uncharacterized Zn-finger protein
MEAGGERAGAPLMAYSLWSLAAALGVKEVLRLESRDGFLLDGREVSSEEMIRLLKDLEARRMFVAKDASIDVRKLSNASGSVVTYSASRPPVFLEAQAAETATTCEYCGGTYRDLNDACRGCGAL